MKTLKLYFISRLILLIFTLVFISSCKNIKSYTINNESVKAKLFYEDDFNRGLNNWQVEQMPGGTVVVKNSKLEIDDVKGCTVWLKQKIEGPVVIEYDVFIIDEGGPNDRVSDLNCFWMATDPENPENLFQNSKKRGGKFSNYDSLKLYYMGVGGNDNSTTRFRRYTGTGERPLLPENDLKGDKYMVKANVSYHIKIIAYKNTIQYYKDDVLFSDYSDENPYTSGYFGLRTVKNHMIVDNFKIYKIKEVK